MQAHEKQEFTRFLTQALGYWKADVSEFTLSVWLHACQSYTLDQVRKAMTAHATDPEHGQFAPKVADIVRILSGTQTDRALLAWGKTLDAMARVGAYSDVCFDDPAIHAAIEDCGGWVKVCRTQTSELSYLQHRFCQAHKAYVGRGTFDYPPRLLGDRSPDFDYTKKGIPPPAPALIGDQERAKLVYQGGNMSGKTAVTFAPFEVLERLADRRMNA
jgi:hypothetical protein